MDHGRCEAKRDCVRVCPYDVFEVRRMDAEDFTALGMLGKLRSTAHRRMTAYTVRADQCHECGLCVTACPEDAITLVDDPSTARFCVPFGGGERDRSSLTGAAGRHGGTLRRGTSAASEQSHAPRTAAALTTPKGDEEVNAR